MRYPGPSPERRPALRIADHRKTPPPAGRSTARPRPAPVTAAARDRHKGGTPPRNAYPHPVQNMASLAVACVLGILVLGMVIAMVLREDTEDTGTDWASLFALGKTEGPLQLAGVTLGMTPADVRRLHPTLALTPAETGETTGTFVFRGIPYSVWFLSRDDGEKAFRIRGDEVLPTFTEANFQARFAQKLGRPATSECIQRKMSGADECRFRWWPSGGASLNVAITQVKTSAGRPRTTLTTVLADTYLEGKRGRVRPAPQAR